jgi:hypothetical protein
MERRVAKGIIIICQHRRRRRTRPPRFIGRRYWTFPASTVTKLSFPAVPYKRKWRRSCTAPNSRKRTWNVSFAWNHSVLTIPACPPCARVERTKPSSTCPVYTNGLNNPVIVQAVDNHSPGKNSNSMYIILITNHQSIEQLDQVHTCFICIVFGRIMPRLLVILTRR